ncbi:MAG: hypothetical protein SOW59_02940 [Corynebacterium sp.]|nr:hypothetical protein [Corynebacterium sp.]
MVIGKESKGIIQRLESEALRDWASNGFIKALLRQQSVAENHVSRLRRVHPNKSPEQMVQYFSKLYLASVTASGAGAGMAAAVPNGAIQIPAALADLTFFLESSVLYVLSLAEIYGVDVEDLERRRFLVMTALLGNSGTKTVTNALGKKTVPYWSKSIINRIPAEAIKSANKVLGPRFITKYGTKQGTLVLGKQLPLTLGTAVGAGGNLTFGYFVVRSCKGILGESPSNWDHYVSKGDAVIDAQVVEELASDFKLE